MSDNQQSEFSIGLAMVPIIYLVTALSYNVFVFGDNGLSGPNQLIILSAAVLAAALAIFKGISWESLQEGIRHNIHTSAIAILILLMVGALSGTWLISGIIPTMIYYGLKILNPTIFLPATLITCALVSIATGSSWTTAATIGIALMGIGNILGIDPGLVAGAIISGSYFGDKMSPLSDTTNLAASVSGVPLFKHIKYMSLTTIPSISISLVIFLAIGLAQNSSQNQISNDTILIALEQNFTITPLLFIAPIIVIAMVVKQTPALPAIFFGMAMGAVLALIFQPHLVHQVGVQELANTENNVMYAGLLKTIFGSIEIQTGNTLIDGLLTSGGMAGMLNTIWLILSAMTFGGILEASGILATITKAIMSKVHSIKSLVASTVGCCIFTNVSASDQYLSVVLPGRMFPDSYKQLGLAPENLSRTLEDSGTVTSVLVPWNTCAAYHAGVLGVSTLSYAPYCFFNMISPIMTLLFAFIGIKIAYLVKQNGRLVNALETGNAN